MVTGVQTCALPICKGRINRKRATQRFYPRKAVLLLTVLLLLSGCRNRARMATNTEPTPEALATVEPIATLEPIATTPPYPIAQDADADLGPFINWLALISVLLLFVAIASGAFFVYCYFISRWAFQRNSHLFTRRNTQ